MFSLTRWEQPPKYVKGFTGFVGHAASVCYLGLYPHSAISLFAKFVYLFIVLI